MKKSAVPLYIALSIFIWSALACNQDTPISTGLDLVNPDDRGQILKFIQKPMNDSTGSKVINTAGSPYLLLGTFDHVESRILLRFDDLPDSGTVVAAKLKLPAHLAMGTGENFHATVHEVLTKWDETKITWGDQPFPVQFDPAAMDTQQITTASTDTTTFNLKSSVVASWFKSSPDKKDSTGVLIQAFGATFQKEFYSRFSTQKQPVLELVTRKATTNDTTRHAATASVFIFKRLAELRKGPLYVGHGEKHQSALFFNLDSIPKNATINRAVLTFEVDTLNSVNNSDAVSVVLYYSLKNNKLDPLNTPADSLMFIQQLFVSDSTLSVTFTVTNLVQAWVRELIRNYGINVLPLFPERDLLRVAFYSKATDASRAPRLQIEYTTPPKLP